MVLENLSNRCFSLLTILNYFYINHFYFTSKGVSHMESTNSSKYFPQEKNGRRYNEMVFDSHGNSKMKICTKM